MKACFHCHLEFLPKNSQQIYCTKKCKYKAADSKRHNKIRLRAKYVCCVCGKQTHNPKYCSKSCNSNDLSKPNHLRKSPIKLKNYHCIACNVIIRTGWEVGSKFCELCRTDSAINPNHRDWSKVTLKQFRARFKNAYQYNARLRSLSRKQIEKTPCKVCGYDKFVEVCHVKPVSSFSEDTVITVVNDPSNLVCLCPNHHWELDHGLIQL